MNDSNCKRLQRIVLPLLLLAVPLSIYAQTDRGTVTETITDSSDAVIPSVNVVATQVATGVTYKAASNGLGFYSLLNLPIGAYNIHSDTSGFNTRTGAIVETQHALEVDPVLRLGNLTQTVWGTGTRVLELQTEVGTNMSVQVMTDLTFAVNGGRDITSFAFAITPSLSGNEWTISIGGSQASTKSVFIDCILTDSGTVGQIAKSEPSLDAIQESQVDTTGLRTEDRRIRDFTPARNIPSESDHA